MEEMDSRRKYRMPVFAFVVVIVFLVYFLARTTTSSSATTYSETDIQWQTVFTFIPKNGKQDCRQYFKNRTTLPYDYQQMKTVKRFQNTLKELSPNLEGHTGKYPEKQRAYWHLASQPFVKVICEIGFNAGHSALVWLSANPKARLISFDLGEHHYTRPMAEFLRREFPNRFELHLGDSRITVLDFLKSQNSPKCDICVIDGGHTYDIALKDFKNMRYLANYDNNIVVLDDFPTYWSMDTLGKVWDDAIKSGDLKEFYRCEYGNNEFGGYSIGTYLLPHNPKRGRL